MVSVPRGSSWAVGFRRMSSPLKTAGVYICSCVNTLSYIQIHVRSTRIGLGCQSQAYAQPTQVRRSVTFRCMLTYVRLCTHCPIFRLIYHSTKLELGSRFRAYVEPTQIRRGPKSSCRLTYVDDYIYIYQAGKGCRQTRRKFLRP